MGSASGEGKQGGVVAGVGGLQCGDIGFSRGTGIDQVAAAPGEARLPKTLNQQIGHQARVAAVAIRKGMDGDQTVMETHGDFIGWLAGVFDLVVSVVQQLFQFNTDLEPIHTDVFVRLTKVTRPLPSVAEHLLV